jgi:ribosome-associated translation inhibitor RaiA
MEIQVHTDHHVEHTDELVEYVEDEVTDGLDEFSDRLMRVHVHLGNESSAHRGPADIKCLIEVHPSGHSSVAVTHHATTTDEATTGATQKMHDLLGGMFGRLSNRHAGAASIRRHQS